MRGRCLVGLLTTVLFVSDARGQGNVEVTLEGRVEAVYLSIKVSDPVYVIQVFSKNVLIGGNSPGDDSQGRLGRPLPSPGETVFVTVSDSASRYRGRLASDTLPAAGQIIRAELISKSPGKWEAAGSHWFEVVKLTSADDRSPPDAWHSDSRFVDVRGMSCEAKIISGQIAFEVKNVDPKGPARDAGFQVGDIITAVAGKPVPSVAALRELAAKPGELELTVIDINSGRLAKVALASARVAPTLSPVAEKPAEFNEAAITARIASSLGITVTPSRVGLRQSAVAVSQVDPTGGGAAAGLEVGDVILSINERPIASAEEFAAVLPGAGGTVTLLVRDSRSGSDVPVQAVCRNSGGAQPAQTAPPKKRTSPTGPTDDLGLATELTFYQAEAAVQVVAVQPGSAASRAGIEPGWIILSVNGKPVLHPDDLKSAVAAAQGAVEMNIADPNSKQEIKIRLPR